ncbi:hypothetical protein M9H77_02087 [Catharanthus roseus]|uniref:Uncharacterized protein n=1 Tax=Catharanthus roseus TaxID=4058 RepID=A0ACC0C7J8_CATRO|nr:hypothetical protein M9H77_02087 [Catharanthus roseus]
MNGALSKALESKDPPRNDKDDQPRDRESGLSICNGQGRAKYTTELRTRFPSLTKSNVQTGIKDEFSMGFLGRSELKMVRGSKKRAHPAAASTPAASTLAETSSTPVETASTPASILPSTSLSSTVASTPPRMSTSPVAASTPQRP